MKRLLLPLILCAVGSLGYLFYLQATAGTETLAEDNGRPEAEAQEPRAMTGEAGTRTGPDNKAPNQPGANDHEASRQPLPADTEALVTLRGRCVHAGSQRPVAGSRVVVGGWFRKDALIDPAAKPDPLWKQPPHQVTGADGCFTVSFVPPPSYQFYIAIDTQGLATMYGRWVLLKPGREELGDIAIPPGCRITGRILDENGVPQAGAYITLHREGAQGMPRGILFAEHSYDQCTRDDGYFELNTALAAGKWYPDVSGRRVLKPKVLEVPERPVDQEVIIRVAARADVPAITGRVFDDARRPVAEAWIHAEPKATWPAIGIRGPNKTQSSKDGSFRLECKRRVGAGPVKLLVSHEGYEPLVSDDLYTWGTEGVVLRMPRGVDVELLVLDDATGQPVTDYALRCFVDLGKDFYSARAQLVREANNGRLRLGGHHENGLARIRGLVAGKHLLMVFPAATTEHAPAAWHRFQVEKGVPRQVVRLEPAPRRILEVVSTAGKPIAGTQVELFYSSAQQPITLYTRLQDLDTRLPFGPSLLKLQAGTTDASGRLELSGPPHEKLSLRLNGPGHIPRLVQDVVLAEAGPLRVVVEVGATLVGKATPLAVLKEFGVDLARLNQQAARGDAWLKAATPGFRLHKEGGGPLVLLPKDNQAGFPLAEDGSFQIPDIPPGTWHLCFKYLPRHQTIWAVAVQAEVQTIHDLLEGETREITVDLSPLRPATLTGTAFVNGQPLKKGQLLCSRRKPAPDSQTLSTGEDGSFALRGVAGEFEICALVPPPDGKGPFLTLLPPLPLTLEPGATRQQDLQFHCGRLRLRILGADGKTPAVGVGLFCATEDNKRAVTIHKPDHLGRIQMDVFPQGSFTLKAWPKHLASPSARYQQMRKNPRGGYQDAMVAVATFQVAPGETTTQDVILPASLGY